MGVIQVESATPADLPAIRELLQRLDLPAQDLGAPNQRFLVARDGVELAGCVALENYGDAALLRSLAVPPSRQRQGLGNTLHERALGVAREAGITDVFLLTTTAETFFARQGYARVARSAVPAPVQASPEFRSLCPAAAVCMTRRLA
jgi:N-acetylglutamate synthase-like GNAT family acetyltransferase